jgi:hypothetical protein
VADEDRSGCLLFGVWAALILIVDAKLRVELRNVALNAQASIVAERGLLMEA